MTPAALGALLVVLLSARSVAPGQPPPPDRLGRKVSAELEANAVDSTSQAPALPAHPGALTTPQTVSQPPPEPQPRAHFSWAPTSPRLRNRTTTTTQTDFLRSSGDEHLRSVLKDDRHYAKQNKLDVRHVEAPPVSFPVTSSTAAIIFPRTSPLTNFVINNIHEVPAPNLVTTPPPPPPPSSPSSAAPIEVDDDSSPTTDQGVEESGEDEEEATPVSQSFTPWEEPPPGSLWASASVPPVTTWRPLTSPLTRLTSVSPVPTTTPLPTSTSTTSTSTTSTTSPSTTSPSTTSSSTISSSTTSSSTTSSSTTSSSTISSSTISSSTTSSSTTSSSTTSSSPIPFLPVTTTELPTPPPVFTPNPEPPKAATTTRPVKPAIPRDNNTKISDDDINTTLTTLSPNVIVGTSRRRTTATVAADAAVTVAPVTSTTTTTPKPPPSSPPPPPPAPPSTTTTSTTTTTEVVTATPLPTTTVDLAEDVTVPPTAILTSSTTTSTTTAARPPPPATTTTTPPPPPPPPPPTTTTTTTTTTQPPPPTPPPTSTTAPPPPPPPTTTATTTPPSPPPPPPPPPPLPPTITTTTPPPPPLIPSTTSTTTTTTTITTTTTTEAPPTSTTTEAPKPTTNATTPAPPSTTISSTTTSTSTAKTTTSYTPLSTEEIKRVNETAPAYLLLLLEMSWPQLCSQLHDFRSKIAALVSNGTSSPVSPSQVVFLNVGEEECRNLESSSEDDSPSRISVHMFLADGKKEKYSHNLTENFLQVWGCHSLKDYTIRKVDRRVIPGRDSLNSNANAAGAGIGAIVAIALSCIAALCLVLLGALLILMRKRQKSLTYGQRCTPVSLDAYSLDSVSVCNSGSVRRKAGRASKRSYGNPAFHDPAAVSHPAGFSALVAMSGDRSATDAEFAAIPQVAPKPDEMPAGADAKNRYANVIPLPETRVTLSCRGGDPLSQYINANYVRGPKNTEKFYIACQAPLASTVEDFWRMIWETQAKVILMLTDLVESGVEKCANYLPPSEVIDCHRLFGDFQVTLKKREVKDKYIVSSIQLKNMETNLWREATHLWYLGWPVKGVPEDPSSIIAFLIEARVFMRGPTSSGSKNPLGPHVVHCSPGTGRTGTVLAIDLCIRDFETTRQVDIPKVVYRLRKDRAGCVQTKEQYHFIYKALNLYATKLTGGSLESL